MDDSFELAGHRFTNGAVGDPEGQRRSLVNPGFDLTTEEPVEKARGVPDRSRQQDVGHRYVVQPVQAELREEATRLEIVVPY